MDQKRTIELCHLMVSLTDNPQPGLASWNLACEQTARSLHLATCFHTHTHESHCTTCGELHAEPVPAPRPRPR